MQAILRAHLLGLSVSLPPAHLFASSRVEPVCRSAILAGAAQGDDEPDASVAKKFAIDPLGVLKAA
jgi:hypothetical protein